MGLDISIENQLIPNLPNATTALQNKYSTISPLLSSLPPGVRRSLIDLDVSRVTRGQRPLTTNETARAVQSAVTGQPATPPPERGTSPLDIIGNVFKDVGTIAKSIPRLPGALIREGFEAPQGIAEAAGSLARGDIASALEAPGVRLVPGAYVGAQLAKGEPSELAKHPGFALLDVAPFIARPGAQAAKAAGQRFAATETGQSLLTSTPGQFARAAFGPVARDVSRGWNQMQARILERFRGKSADTGADIEAANAASRFTEKYRGALPPERIEELTRLGEIDPRRIRFSDDPVTADLERGLLADWREVNDAMFRAGYSTEDILQLDINGTPEIFDRVTGNKILRSRSSRDAVAKLVEVRQAIERPPNDPAHLLGPIRRVVNDPDISATRKLTMLDGYIRAYGSTGADNTRLLEALRNTKSSKDFDEILAAVDDTNPIKVRSTPDDFLPQLRNFRRDPQALRLADAIEDSNWSRAIKLSRQLEQRKTQILPNLSELREGIKQRAKAERFLDTDKMLKSSERLLKRLQRQTQRLEETSPPARFIPALQEEMARRLSEGKVAVGDRLVFTENPNLPRALQLIKERNFNLLEGFDEAAFRRLQRDVNSTWQELRADGLDPIYLHHVTPQQAELLDYPRPLRGRPSQVKQRTNDYTPYIKDATVAVSAQALEWLSRRGAVEFADFAADTWGKPLRQLQEEYLPQARLRAERRGLSPEEVNSELQSLISREWTRYDPTSLFEFPNKRLNVLRDQDLYIPRTAQKVIEQFRHKGGRERFSSTLDPVMGIFRASVLALSPRWHCVPEDSEILTYNGWETYDRLVPDDQILTWNVDSQQFEWEPVGEISVFNFDGDLQLSDGFAATIDHRWPVLTQWQRSHNEEWQIKRGHDLSRGDYFLRAAHTYKAVDSTLTSREAAILGWLVTEGTISWSNGWPQARIYQKPGPKLDSIVELLGKDGGQVSLDHRSYDNTELLDEPASASITVKASLLHKYDQVGYRIKEDLPGLIPSLSTDAMKAMWEAMLAGDGHLHPSGLQFCQKPGPVWEAFQLLCFFLGYKVDTGGVSHIVAGTGPTGTKSGHLFRVKRIETQHYKGRVWCPQTRNKTWVMRQNGRIVVTGNTNNILGGAVLLTARSDFSVFKYFKVAREAARTGTDPRTGKPLPDELRLAIGARERLDVGFHHAAGRSLGRLFSEIPVSGSTRRAGARAAQGISNVVERSFQFNSMVDDMYRVMAYLYGHDKALTKGLTREAAQQSGQTLARKVLQEWAAYTPIERTILRSVLPFYSWIGHIVRYSLNYPVDHPFRTSIVESLGQIARDDIGDGLPERFLNAIFLGQPNEDGSVQAINFGYTNPFADVANYASMSGFLSALNPLISTVAEASGIDPISGRPEAFPDLQYDADSGRLVAKTDNPVFSVIQNIIPQTELLNVLVGRNKEFQELAQSNPTAARRRLLSSFGFSSMIQEVNIPEQRMRSELARGEAQSRALREAFRGDPSQARRFPGLTPALERLEQLPEEAVSPFRLPEGLSPGQRRIVRSQERLLGLNLP